MKPGRDAKFHCQGNQNRHFQEEVKHDIIVKAVEERGNDQDQDLVPTQVFQVLDEQHQSGCGTGRRQLSILITADVLAELDLRHSEHKAIEACCDRRQCAANEHQLQREGGDAEERTACYRLWMQIETDCYADGQKSEEEQSSEIVNIASELAAAFQNSRHRAV